jgi:hypothetical protein
MLLPLPPALNRKGIDATLTVLCQEHCATAHFLVGGGEWDGDNFVIDSPSNFGLRLGCGVMHRIPASRPLPHLLCHVQTPVQSPHTSCICSSDAVLATRNLRLQLKPIRPGHVSKNTPAASSNYPHVFKELGNISSGQVAQRDD